MTGRSPTDPMKPAQIRGAWGMLDWSIVDLARAARVSVATVRRMEAGESLPLEPRLAVWDAFLAVGVRFIDDARGYGVRIDPP